MFGPKERTATGIHIVDNTLCIVQIVGVEEVTELHALVQHALSGPIEPGRLDGAGGREELIQALRHVQQDRGLSFENSVIALSQDAFHLKSRPLVVAGEKANREHLLWETKQVLAGNLDAYSIDFALTRHCGFVVAAHRRVLDLYLDVCTQGGIKNPDFDIPPFALYNAMEVAGLLSAKQVALALDIEPFRACAILVRDGEMAGVASCSWDKGAEMSTRISDLKERLGVLLEEGDEAERPQRMWIAGTVARESQWSVELAEKLGMSGALIDPFRGIDISPLDNADASLLSSRSKFAISAGLAFRGLFL